MRLRNPIAYLIKSQIGGVSMVFLVIFIIMSIVRAYTLNFGKTFKKDTNGLKRIESRPMWRSKKDSITLTQLSN